MTTITVKQFLALGHKVWREIHWTSQRTLPEGVTAYAVGYDKKGKIIPFAIWFI